MDMMMKGWALVNWYYLCKGEKELVNHILIHCSLACTLWHLLCSFFGLSWNPPRLVKEVSLGWHGGWEKCRKVWRMTPFFLFWIIWGEEIVECPKSLFFVLFSYGLSSLWTKILCLYWVSLTV